MMNSGAEYQERALALLGELVAFDTVSHNSNLEFIDFVENYLANFDLNSCRVGSEGKANLLAAIGPVVEGGVVLSGHTDVVPVDGQSWSSAPFALTERDGRLYGRGTCDMKGFIACALAAVPLFVNAKLTRPVYLAFSYDEEVGCLGAPAMIETMTRDLPRPAAVIVGEPSLMQIISSHKGLAHFEVIVTGRAAHSSLTHIGLSANEVAVRLMHILLQIADQLKTRAGEENGFVPPHATLTIGTISGGTAVNILAGDCRFRFDLRCLPEMEPYSVLEPFMAEVARLDAQMKERFPETGICIKTAPHHVPSFRNEQGGYAEDLVRRLTGDNRPASAVSYGSEAGQFQSIGLSTVICGPGSIEQAHQPDEYIARDQIAACMIFMERLAQELSGIPDEHNPDFNRKSFRG